MIHVRLAGGLGNQLFQLAAAALADPSGRSRIVAHTGALGLYAVSRQPDSITLLKKTVQSASTGSWFRRGQNWMIESGRAGRWLPVVGIDDRQFVRKMQRVNQRSMAILDGYFQYGWTAAMLDLALERLNAPVVQLSAAGRIGASECAIHIRGGDFLRLPHYQVASPAYYREAVERARAAGYTRFAVLTDDPDHASNLCTQVAGSFPKGSVRMVESTADALYDFDTLRGASARIIGNSTFAWWAAALDSERARTWSPTQFTRNEVRDFFLPWETPINTQDM